MTQNRPASAPAVPRYSRSGERRTVRVQDGQVNDHVTGRHWRFRDYVRGDWEADWDALYWTFVRDHHDVFAGNPRSQMIATLYDRLDPAKKAAHTKRAHGWLEG